MVTAKSQHWCLDEWVLSVAPGFPSHHRCPFTPLTDETKITNKRRHQNMTQVSYNRDAINNGTTVGSGLQLPAGMASLTPSAKPSGEVGSAGPSCSRPRHSTRLHHQPRLWFASRPVVVSCFVGFDLQPLFISQKCRLCDKQTTASRCHHSLWHRQTMWVPHLCAPTWCSLSPPCFCLLLLTPSLTLSLPPLLFLIKHYDSSFAQWCKRHGSFVIMPSCSRVKCENISSLWSPELSN